MTRGVRAALQLLCAAALFQLTLGTAPAFTPGVVVDAHDVVTDAVDHGDGAAGGHGNCSADHSIGHAVHEFAEFKVFPFSLALMVAIVAGALLHQCEALSSLPESLLVIAVGGICAVCFNAMHTIDERSYTDNFEMILNFFCLPIIIFESGWSLRTRDFLSQLPWIIIYAVCGTVISWLIVAYLTYYTGNAGWHGITDWRTAMCFSSLISAVDPVASLATYSALKVEPLLNIVVFGESTINDAVAIAIFAVLNNNKIMAPELECDFNTEHLSVTDRNLLIAGNILWLLVGSVVVGVVIGSCVVLVLRVTGMHHVPALAMLFCFVSSFFTFSLAEALLGLSGIIACLFSGIILGEYARPHLGLSGSLLFSFFIKRLSSMADISVFLLAGFAVIFFNRTGVIFGLFTMLFCVIGRACAIFPVSLIVNALKKCSGRAQGDEEHEMHLIDFGRQVMMLWGGLRGGIAIVLVLKMGDWVNLPGTNALGAESRNAMRNGTFLLVMAFLLIFGSTTEMMLTLFKIPMGADVPDREAMFEEEALSAEKKCVGWLRNSFFEPLLVGSALEKDADLITDNNAKSLSIEDVLYEAADSKFWRSRSKNSTDGDLADLRQAERNRHIVFPVGGEELSYATDEETDS